MDARQAEEEFANIAFKTLDKSSLVKVLEKLDPVTVLSLCQTNHHFAEVCQDRTVFVKLMQVHYPNFPINQDAKAQYMAITAGEGVGYVIDYGYKLSDEDGDLIAFPAKEDVDSTNPNLLFFTILGTKIRKGEKLFLIVRVRGMQYQKQVFLTKEDVIEEIASDQREVVQFQIKSIDEIRRIVNGKLPISVIVNKITDENRVLRYRYTVIPFTVG